MEHTKAYQEFKKNGNTKFVRYSEGAEMYHMRKDQQDLLQNMLNGCAFFATKSSDESK